MKEESHNQSIESLQCNVIWNIQNPKMHIHSHTNDNVLKYYAEKYMFLIKEW